jgi:hypothetical protein
LQLMSSQLHYHTKKMSNFRKDRDDSHFLIYHPCRHLLSIVCTTIIDCRYLLYVRP